LLGIAAGLVAFFYPGITSLVLLLCIAGWAIFTGIAEIAAAIRLRKLIEGEWLLILAGAATVIVGLLLAAFPGPGALAVVLWIGAYAIGLGILLLVLAFKLRRYAHTHTDVREIPDAQPHPV